MQNLFSTFLLLNTNCVKYQQAALTGFLKGDFCVKVIFNIMRPKMNNCCRSACWRSQTAMVVYLSRRLTHKLTTGTGSFIFIRKSFAIWLLFKLISLLPKVSTSWEGIYTWRHHYRGDFEPLSWGPCRCWWWLGQWRIDNRGRIPTNIQVTTK